MKIKIEKGDLLSAVQVASRGIPSHTTQPILECIVVEAKESSIAMRSTDMEIAICTIADGDVIEDGTVALDAKIFLDIAKKMPDGEITIESNDEFQTKIVSGKTKFKIAGRDASVFPKTAEADGADEVIISEFSLKELIRTTLFSVDFNAAQKSMTGELLKVNGDRLSAISLDGHRISIRNIDLLKSYDPVSAIVPGKTLMEIQKALSGDADKDCTIIFGEKTVLFSFGSTTLISRVIEGAFFDIRSIVNIQPEMTVTVNKQDFADCIDRAALFVKDGTKKPVILETKDNAIEVRIESTLGSMNEIVYCSRTGGDIKIGMNPAFLSDILKNIDEEEITLYFVGEKQPCIIRDRESYLYLALPVALK